MWVFLGYVFAIQSQQIRVVVSTVREAKLTLLWWEHSFVRKAVVFVSVPWYFPATGVKEKPWLYNGILFIVLPKKHHGFAFRETWKHGSCLHCTVLSWRSVSHYFSGNPNLTDTATFNHNANLMLNPNLKLRPKNKFVFMNFKDIQ
jgi:hypothetical protein